MSRGHFSHFTSCFGVQLNSRQLNVSSVPAVVSHIMQLLQSPVLHDESSRIKIHTIIIKELCYTVSEV